jgi:glucokinase
MSVLEVGLIGDIGATNARFALVQADGSMCGLTGNGIRARSPIRLNNHERTWASSVLYARSGTRAARVCVLIT